ncbi:hypothetical protein BJ878DRAFT_475742 [Calycina marina]|uniref:Acetylserotonin methytransferase-like protein n=1 Tax=Calycina marina TaxID=1763456 RepID=A0A9P8CJT7_9HELO|nr:hypothetical protein BJ878DRAFT_475742 [Calycina marina]
MEADDKGCNHTRHINDLGSLFSGFANSHVHRFYEDDDHNVSMAANIVVKLLRDRPLVSRNCWCEQEKNCIGQAAYRKERYIRRGKTTVFAMSSAPDQKATGKVGLQLFPPPPKKAKPARKSSTKRHAASASVEVPSSEVNRAASTPYQGHQIQQSSTEVASPLSGNRVRKGSESISPISVPGPSYQPMELPRSQTSFSEAPTLVRGISNASGSSIAKRGLHESPPRGEEPVMRSIFPRYNPDIPLEHQNYFPTQASPTHIPREVINRRPYSPSLHDRSPIQSPMALGTSPGRYPRGISEEPVMETSTVDEMKELWKVVNGWRVSNSEGRKFCLKLSSSTEEPVHTLSCTTQRFYTLKIMPTSTSAQMTMLRHDPHKVPKESSLLRRSSKPDAGSEVMGVTLEEDARRLPPNDGLVALLFPQAASNMVIDLANNPTPRADAEAVMQAAERECGRLVWDEDTKKPLSTPFVIVVASSPAWSRVEYTLEHPEMPRNLVRLVKDGTGGGTLEIDTAVAARIDAFYVVDVAVCAILLAAAADEKERRIERFDAPPSIAPHSPLSPRSSLRSPITGMGKFAKLGRKETNLDKETKMEEFEVDIESQQSMTEKEKNKRGKEEKVPGFFGLIWMLAKFVVWAIAFLFKGLAKIIIWLSSCLTSKSKS